MISNNLNEEVCWNCIHANRVSHDSLWFIPCEKYLQNKPCDFQSRIESRLTESEINAIIDICFVCPVKPYRIGFSKCPRCPVNWNKILGKEWK